MNNAVAVPSTVNAAQAAEAIAAIKKAAAAHREKPLSHRLLQPGLARLFAIRLESAGKS